MLAYNEWADDRIVDAAQGLAADKFGDVADTLAHALGTQCFWLANWTGAPFVDVTEKTFAELRAGYARSHKDLREFAEGLTDEAWNRAEAWWKRWGYDATATLGQTVFQVIYHGIQHRAEIAIILTDHGCSPGDMDYLNFLPGLPQE
jgi:uncharacterized damage-inducible protein DinB